MSMDDTQIVEAGKRYENVLYQPFYPPKSGLWVKVPKVLSAEQLVEALINLGYKPPKKDKSKQK